MSTWKLSSGRTFFVVAAVAVLVIAVSMEMTGQFDKPNGETSASASHDEHPAVSRVTVTNKGVTYYHQEKAEPEHEEPDWWSIPYEGWVALLTGMLFISTTLLWLSTNQLWKSAETQAVVLERAYLRITVGASNTQRAIEMAHQDQQTFAPQIMFTVTNHGKTPADNISGSAQFVASVGTKTRTHQKDDGELAFESRTLGAGKPTTPFIVVVKSEFGAADALAIDKGGGKLMLLGEIVYSDLWSNQYVEQFEAIYEPARKTFAIKRGERKTGKDHAFPISRWDTFWSRVYHFPYRAQVWWGDRKIARELKRAKKK